MKTADQSQSATARDRDRGSRDVDAREAGSPRTVALVAEWLQQKAGNQAAAALLQTGSRTLTATERADVEPVVGGVDDVRVHDGEVGGRVTDLLGAQGASIGTHVFLGPHVSGAAERSALLAHEAAHAVQQRSAAEPRDLDQLPVDPSEAREAEAVHAGEVASVLAAVRPARAAAPRGPAVPLGSATVAASRAPTLPKLTKQQRQQLDRIMEKLEASGLTLNEVGIADEQQLVDLLKQGSVDAGLDKLEGLVDRAADVRAAATRGNAPGAEDVRKLQIAEEGKLPDQSRLPKAKSTPGETWGTARGGRWFGEPGNSEWASDMAAVNAVTGGEPVPFHDGHPDFRKWARERAFISDMKGTDADFAAANRSLAMQKGWLWRGKPNAAEAARFMEANRLTWHHVEGSTAGELIAVPMDLHGNVPHIGSASEARHAKAGTAGGGQPGVEEGPSSAEAKPANGPAAKPPAAKKTTAHAPKAPAKAKAEAPKAAPAAAEPAKAKAAAPEAPAETKAAAPKAAPAAAEPAKAKAAAPEAPAKAKAAAPKAAPVATEPVKAPKSAAAAEPAKAKAAAPKAAPVVAEPVQAPKPAAVAEPVKASPPATATEPVKAAKAPAAAEPVKAAPPAVATEPAKSPAASAETRGPAGVEPSMRIAPGARALDFNPGGADAKAGLEGGAMMLHSFQESQLVGIEHDKERAEFERMRPFIQRALASGKWVIVESVWVKTRDPIGDVAGYHEMGTLPEFKYLTWRAESSEDELAHPKPTPPTMSAAPADPRPPSRELAELPRELEEHAEKYVDVETYATFAPSPVLALPGGPVSYPDIDRLMGHYGEVDGSPTSFVLSADSHGLRIAAAWVSRTQRNWTVTAEHWTWKAPIVGVLESSLLDAETGTRVESALWFLVEPKGVTSRESFTVTEPDGRTRTGNVERWRGTQ